MKQLRTKYLLLAITTTTLLLSACVSGGPKKGSAPTKESVKAFFKRARDPRVFNVTVYRTDAGTLFENTFRLHPLQVSEMPFALKKKKGAAPLVMLPGVGGVQIPALIDTHSYGNWVTFDSVQSIGATALGPKPIPAYPLHVRDDRIGFAGLAPSFNLPNLQFESAIINIRPQFKTLGPLNRGVTHPEPLVVLGGEVMRTLAFFQIDYPGRRVIASSEREYTPDPARLIASLDLQFLAEGLAVMGMMETFTDGEGSPYVGPIIIDSAGPYTLALPSEEALTTEKQLTLGDIVLRQVPVTNGDRVNLPAETFPSVGIEFLKDFVITIDGRHKKIHFELPPKK